MQLKGFLWYQGESDASPRREEAIQSASKYEDLLQRLITSWRESFKQELPFYFVQLPEFKKVTHNAIEMNDEWAMIRPSMLRASQTIDNTHMAITLGLGQADDVHPIHKRGVGRRLGLLALYHTYNHKLPYSGPRFVSAQFSASRQEATLLFDTGGADLALEGNTSSLNGFAALDSEGLTISVKAQITACNTVTVTANSPMQSIFYAWAANPQQANLANTAHLPASPFSAQ